MVQEITKSSGLRKCAPQLLTGFGVTMAMMQIGFLGSWSSPYLVKLTAPDSSLPLSLDQASWVASLVNLSRIIGAILGAMTVNCIGSKRTLFLVLLPISICWMLIMLARSVTWLYVARLSGGLSTGMIYSSAPLYLGEVALPKIRGSLVSLAISGGLTIGNTLGNIAGGYLNMETSAGIYLVPCMALIVLFFWLPESPHHLVKTENFEKAKKSIEWYYAGNRTEEELEAVKEFVSSSNKESFWEKLATFRKPVLIRSTILVIVLWIFSQICGFNIIIFYMEMILIQAKSHLIEPKAVVVYASASSVIASILSIILVDKCGRRFLLIVSSLGVTISMAGLGAHFVLIEQGIDVKDFQWLPFVSIFLFNTTFFVGLVCVPSTVLSELFPANIKCIASCMASLTGAMFAFIVTKTYQPLIELIGQSNVYFMYGAITFLAIPYALICMPETKGKTLQQIQDKLVKR